jgi:hypothetical protein
VRLAAAGGVGAFDAVVGGDGLGEAAARVGVVDAGAAGRDEGLGVRAGGGWQGARIFEPEGRGPELVGPAVLVALEDVDDEVLVAAVVGEALDAPGGSGGGVAGVADELDAGGDVVATDDVGEDLDAIVSGSSAS